LIIDQVFGVGGDIVQESYLIVVTTTVSIFWTVEDWGRRVGREDLDSLISDGDGDDPMRL
jgi:hypothetical protein